MRRLLTFLASFFVCSMLWAENFVVSGIYNLADLDYTKNYKGVKQIKVMKSSTEVESVANFDKEGRLVSDTIIDGRGRMVLLFHYSKEAPILQISDSITYILFHYKDDKNITMKFYNAPDKDMGDSVMLALNARKDLTRASYYEGGNILRTMDFQTSWTADGNSCATKKLKNNEVQFKTVTTYKNKKKSVNKGFDSSGNPTFVETFNAYGDLVKQTYSNSTNSSTITYEYDSKGHWTSRTSNDVYRGRNIKTTKKRQVIYY